MSGNGRQTLTEIFTVARDPSVSDKAFRLWLIYRSYNSGSKGAFCGDERMAAHLECSERTLRRWRSTLLESGHLRRKLDGPRPARYWAVVPEGERPDKSVPPRTDDRTNDRTDDRTDLSVDNYSKSIHTQPAAHPSTVLSTVLSTTPPHPTPSVPSLRSGTGDPQDGPPSEREPFGEEETGSAGEGADRCPGCSGPRDAPDLSLCLRCYREQASLPALACQGEADGSSLPVAAPEQAADIGRAP